MTRRVPSAVAGVAEIRKESLHIRRLVEDIAEEESIKSFPQRGGKSHPRLGEKCFRDAPGGLRPPAPD